MVIEISRKDIINFIIEHQDFSYDIVDDIFIKYYGQWEGGFADFWRWNKEKLRECTDGELIRIYQYVIKNREL